VFFVLVVVVKAFWIRVKTFIVLRCRILLFALGSWCGNSVMWVGVGIGGASYDWWSYI